MANAIPCASFGTWVSTWTGSMSDPGAVLVVAPETSFDDIAAALEGLGWERSSSVAAPSLVPGEPEVAGWMRPNESSYLTYTYNPVVGLRVLAIAGRGASQAAAAVAERLSCIDPPRIAASLSSTAPRELLLGLYAAAELKVVALLPQVDSLRVHTDRRVSQIAAQTAQKLSLALLELGASRLADEQRRHPDRSATFSRIGDSVARRETLLWIMHDAKANAEVAKVLRSALADTDWRVRVTAMLVAARMKVAGVWQEVRYMQLPGTGPAGLDRHHLSLLGGVRKAVLSELAGEPLPDASDPRTSLMPHLRAIVAGEDDGIHDEARDWIEGFLRLPAGEGS
jgi:hypothetical protein